MRVLKRDNGICRQCGSSENPTVHHVLPVEGYPHLRYDINNSVVWCQACSEKEDTKYLLANELTAHMLS